MKNILWIDHEAELMLGILGDLKHDGYKVQIAKTADEGFAELERNRRDYDLVIMGLLIPQAKVGGELKASTGMDLLEKIALAWPNLPVIVFTAAATHLDGACHPRRCALVFKPCLPVKVLMTAEQLLSTL